jgi:hypothetical protein
MDALDDLMKDFQCTKWVVTRKAVDIVDRALTSVSNISTLWRRSPPGWPPAP